MKLRDLYLLMILQLHNNNKKYYKFFYSTITHNIDLSVYYVNIYLVI
jgi:hypothetical protein